MIAASTWLFRSCSLAIDIDLRAIFFQSFDARRPGHVSGLIRHTCLARKDVFGRKREMSTSARSRPLF